MVLVVVLMVVLVLVRATFGMARLAMVRLAVMRLGHALLERLELVEHLIAIECADVSRLNRREATDRPTEVHKVRLDRMRERVHPDLLG